MNGYHTARTTLFAALAILLSILFFSPAGADYYYQYTDESGNIFFTDDPGNVPEERRSGMVEHRNIPSTSPASSEKPGQRPDSINQRAFTAGTTWDQNIKQLGASLDQERKALQSQYEDIVKKQQEIGEPPPSTASQSEMGRYEAEVEALNRKIDEYERRRKQFDAQVSEFRTGR